MGCCCPGKADGGGGGGAVEMQAAEATICKIGKQGPKVEVTGANVVGGAGVVLGSCVIDQDAAYWEVKVLRAGGVRIGVARDLSGNLLEQPLGASADDAKSWALDGDHDNEDLFTACPLADGDVVTVLFDQGGLPMLTFLKNGAPLGDIGAVSRIRGAVYAIPRDAAPPRRRDTHLSLSLALSAAASRRLSLCRARARSRFLSPTPSLALLARARAPSPLSPPSLSGTRPSRSRAARASSCASTAPRWSTRPTSASTRRSSARAASYSRA